MASPGTDWVTINSQAVTPLDKRSGCGSGSYPMFGADPRRKAARMFNSMAPISQSNTPATPVQRHEFAYPAVTQVAVRAHAVLASSLYRGVTPVRPVTR